MAPPSPPKTVYVKSKVAVANGIEQTNPEERALVASAQYRIMQSSPSLKSSAASRLAAPIHLFVKIKRMFTNSDAAPVLRLKAVMVLPSLLLGSEYNASRYDELYSAGVTHICNLDFASRNYFEGKFMYIKLNLMDRAEEQLLPQFDGVNAFLEGCEAVGGRALLHCASGNALAPAFMVAYLMAKKSKTMDEAIQLVRAKRPTMLLYAAFIEQLQQYEVGSFWVHVLVLLYA